MASTSEPIIRQWNICPKCNGRWLDRHFCPSPLWRTTAGPYVFVPNTASSAYLRAAGEGDT